MVSIIVLGDVNLDLYTDLPSSFPLDGELRTEMFVEPGGSAANFAKAAAQAGAGVEFVGCVGNDLSGKMLVQSLNEAGVMTHLQYSCKPSGAVVSLKSYYGKTMLCSRGANDMLEPSFIDSKWFVGKDHLHISGYSFLSEVQSSVAKYAIEMAQSRGLKISVDPPPANLIESFGAKRFLSDIKMAWCLFPNLAEGKVLTDKLDPEDMVDALSARFTLGVLTLGFNGSIAWEKGRRSLKHVKEVHNVDPTGAGDAFAAGFTVSYLEHGNLEQAHEAGIEAAQRLLSERSSAKRN